MGKKARDRDLPENEAKAVARMLRVSPQKLNLVAQLIRGKKVAAALADLEFSRKRIARDVRKCLESAIANAENNHDLDVDELVVAEAHVGKAIVIKRFHPRGRGRMGRIFKAIRQPDHRRTRGRGCGVLRGKRWVKRSIRSGCGSVSTAPGIRAGTPARASTGSCCTRI
jgi:large subunit ribosomal protein L22